MTWTDIMRLAMQNLLDCMNLLETEKDLEITMTEKNTFISIHIFTGFPVREFSGTHKERGVVRQCCPWGEPYIRNPRASLWEM